MSRMRDYVSRVPVWVWIVSALAVGLLLGGEMGRGGHDHDSSLSGAGAVEQASEWTCSMHPQIRQPGPGQCPLCGMDLIPVSGESKGDALGPRQIKLSASAQALAEIRTSAVERRNVPVQVDLLGRVAHDETRERHITARVEGRLDRMHVNFTGARVQKGQPLADIYSPELYSAQEELLQALEGERRFGASGLESIRGTVGPTVEAAKKKLTLLGLPESRIQQIIANGKPSTHVTIDAPAGGTVVSKDAIEGQYVNAGSRLYTVVDLSRVWVLLQAYESDLNRIAPGLEVGFTVEAYPGETFSGRVDFVDPVVDRQTRTVDVRLNADNRDGRLKPGMYVRASLKSGVTGVKDSPAPLVIPATAALITGKRAVVYVRVSGSEGVFEGREVVLGPRAGDYYIVREGLAEGEQVVVNGNFKIDSAIQILARPGMMSPEAGTPSPAHRHGDMHASRTGETPVSHDMENPEVPEKFREQLHGLFRAYLRVQRPLSGDDLPAARSGAGDFNEALEKTDISLLDGTSRELWMNNQSAMRRDIDRIVSAGHIDSAREAFHGISNSIIALVKSLGVAGPEPVILIHCPMAFDNAGAEWLQESDQVRNPYFGAMMLRCRDRIDTLYAGTAGSLEN